MGAKWQDGFPKGLLVVCGVLAVTGVAIVGIQAWRRPAAEENRISSTSYAPGEKPSPEAVGVKVLNKALPRDEEKMESFLWKSLNKQEEQKVYSYDTEGWKDNFALFAKALVEKAHAQKLDTASLRKALDLVLEHSKDQIAYLPIAAYQTSLARKPVWIITVKWEYPMPHEKMPLGHVRMFVFDQKTLKQVGFVTCN